MTKKNSKLIPRYKINFYFLKRVFSLRALDVFLIALIQVTVRYLLQFSDYLSDRRFRIETERALRIPPSPRLL